MNSEHPNPHVTRIGGKLLAQRAADLVQELREALGDHECVRCDLSSVEAIDVIGVQLLLAARGSQRAKGRSLQFESPSAPVRELCVALGVWLENG